MVSATPELNKKVTPETEERKTGASGRCSLGSAQLDFLVYGGVITFVVVSALFAIRNNDIWWHLGVGAEMVRTGAFIRTDPFMFSVPGQPWAPHAWLAGLLFYAIHEVGSAAGLVLLRAVLVGSIFVAIGRILRRSGVSLVLAAPIVFVAVLNAHSRFILRPHLFEYLFIVVLIGHLTASVKQRGTRFFLLPILLQMLWVNLHASFYLGVIIVALFYIGEALSAKLAPTIGSRGFLHGEPIHYRGVMILLGLMVVASLINPSPIDFLTSPLGGEQRELLTKYTLEWQSPFDPKLSSATFHPYLEILLAFAALSILVSLRRLRLSSLLLVGFFAVLMLQAHRFRVEFGLVVAILSVEQFSASKIVTNPGKWLRRRAPAATAIVLAASVLVSALLVYTARDRIEFNGAVSDRFPSQSFAFIRDAGVGQRSFTTVGFGSFLIWDQFPDRRSFIDGRNIDADLYRDFLQCQTHSIGFNNTVRKYDLDAFIIPIPENSDGGMRNVHTFLTESDGWALVHLDHVSFVYVKKKKVPGDWLDRNTYRFYNPMTFDSLRFSSAQLDSVEAELGRAADSDRAYARPSLDHARFLAMVGDAGRARGVLERVLQKDPGNAEASALLNRIR